MDPIIAAALMAVVVFAITTFQHYALRNAVWVIVGSALYVAILVWSDAGADWTDVRIAAAAVAGGLVVLGTDRERRRIRQRGTTQTRHDEVDPEVEPPPER